MSRRIKNVFVIATIFLAQISCASEKSETPSRPEKYEICIRHDCKQVDKKEFLDKKSKTWKKLREQETAKVRARTYLVEGRSFGLGFATIDEKRQIIIELQKIISTKPNESVSQAEFERNLALQSFAVVELSKLCDEKSYELLWETARKLAGYASSASVISWA